MRAVLPVMRAQGSGIILNLGSGAAHNPMEGWSHYCAAKAADPHADPLRAPGEQGPRHPRLSASRPARWRPTCSARSRRRGINPVSQMDFASHAPVEVPARALVWLCTEDAAEFAGQEVSLRDPAIRARIGLD